MCKCFSFYQLAIILQCFFADTIQKVFLQSRIRKCSCPNRMPQLRQDRSLCVPYVNPLALVKDRRGLTTNCQRISFEHSKSFVQFFASSGNFFVILTFYVEEEGRELF